MDHAWVVLRRMVSINDAILYFWMISRMNSDREIEASRAEINEQVFGGVNATTSNIVAIIDRLCAMGLLERIPPTPGATRRYRVLVATKGEVLKWQAGPKD